jgi:hypothetical protein
VEEIFGSSEARGQALDTASKAVAKPPRNPIIVREYVSKKRASQTVPNGWWLGSQTPLVLESRVT